MRKHGGDRNRRRIAGSFSMRPVYGVRLPKALDFSLTTRMAFSSEDGLNPRRGLGGVCSISP